MSTSYVMDDDVDLNESPIQMDDLSDQVTNEAMEPATRVPFIIKKATVRTQHEDSKDMSSPWTIKRLSVDVAIQADGVDGEGKYANKHLFPELVLAFNVSDFPERFGSDWWKKSSRGPTKEFFVALGYDPKSLPAIDADFLTELSGKEFIADIKRKPVQEKTDQVNDKGKAVYKDTGDFRNELANFREMK